MKLQEQLQEMLKHLLALGYDTEELVFAPPASFNEIQILERTFGFSLPPSFRDTLLNISSHVEFRWFSPQDTEFPEPFGSNFSGNIHWSIRSLKSFNDKKDEWIEKVFPDPNNSYDLVWHNKLAFYEVGNGDYLAIDLNPSKYEQIVYLSHDDGEGHGHVLAEDFQALLTRWAPLAFTGGEDWQWSPFTNDLTSYIDPNCKNAKVWREVLKIAT
jgi:cell wall assembly regulator SMI1